MSKPQKQEAGEARPVVAFRLDPEVIAEARANTENLARLVEQLLRKHNKEVRAGKVEVKAKREQIEQGLKELQLEWFRIELRRGKESGDEAAVKHYEKLLRGENVNT